jgi:hypothetical protein
VFVTPYRQLRGSRPFLIILAHERVFDRGNPICAPLAYSHAVAPHPQLHPKLRVLGHDVFFLPLDLAALPAARIGPAIDNLAADSFAIIAALDHLFSAAG